MSVPALLARAIEMIEAHPSTHTTGALARDPKGDPVLPCSPYAVAWDTYGLLLKAARKDYFVTGSDAEQASDLVQAAAEQRGYISVRACNDTEGRNGAMWMLRHALHLHELHGPSTPAHTLEGSTS